MNMGQSTNGTNDAAAPPKMDRRRSSIAVPRHLEVLVADDDLDTRSALAKAVAELGHTVRVARDGAEAHRMLQERHADVVISDWEMPGMNGAELCRATRVADEEAPYTYFILMTGHADREHLLAGMNAGADDYQRKPIDLDELEARLVSAARVVALHRRLADRTAALRRDSRRFYVASRTDALTTAGNRLALHEEIEALRSRADRYGHRYCLAICDIDFFKQFNDKFGHLAGDEALRRARHHPRRLEHAADPRALLEPVDLQRERADDGGPRRPEEGVRRDRRGPLLDRARDPPLVMTRRLVLPPLSLRVLVERVHVLHLALEEPVSSAATTCKGRCTTERGHPCRAGCGHAPPWGRLRSSSHRVMSLP